MRPSPSSLARASHLLLRHRHRGHHHRHYALSFPQTLIPSSSLRLLSSSSSDSDADADDLRSAVSVLAAELLASPDASDPSPILSSCGAASLLRRSPDGSASVHLLSLLKPRPLLALEVFSWRRKLGDAAIPLLPEEYAKAIALAGRARNVDLAAALFADALSTVAAEPCLYNALMSAYMYNGLTRKCVAVFEDLRRNPRCGAPTVVTYNILLSLYGRSLLVEHMEAVLRAMDETGVRRSIETYNTVIAAYVTAWRWDRMESTFQSMEAGPVKPDARTHLLLLRGYAHAGELEKMERVYDLVCEQVSEHETPLIRLMICAYCKSSDPERIQKIEGLMKCLKDDEYRPWLNVLLIRVYAQEGLVEAMEQLIDEALKRNTVVTTVGVMRSIISSYFRCDAVDRLTRFVRLAEYAGWRLCRSLYHCKMVMYGKQNRLEEMHSVLDEMENYRFNLTRKTFLIMYKAYWNVGRRSEAETVIGMMWKQGLGSPQDAFIS
ncbi:Pentatricopeptide repeat-containing protein [Ananas comosus]|uniref:Pentatricopeptide repeat-containing protein n=1 Tax=Ananas comosus TaxID=4615 RepID=A0A199UQB0_ANACO|nr:Pentatricopeptide repeat-containing protein [Ananas comosus]